MLKGRCVYIFRVIIGRGGSGKTDLILNEVRNRVKNHANGNILVVPEQYSHEAERTLCEICGDSASMYAQVLSFSRMCNRVFSEQGGLADTYLDEAGKILVMSKAVELASGKAKIYGGLTKRSEYIRKIVSTSKELKSAGISIDDILTVASSARPALKDKLNDIALIIGIYQSMLKNDVLDPDEQLDRLAEMIPNGSFGRNCNIWFDGFSDFTAQQLCVIKALAGNAECITVTLTCDDLYSDDVIFERTRNTAKMLFSIAEEMNMKCEIINMHTSMINRPTELKFLEGNLFTAKSGKLEDECSAVSAYICRDPGEECEMAAAKAVSLVEQGERWSDIAIAVSNIDSYSTILEAVFERYNVPIYQNIKLDIMQMPPVRAVMSALKILTGGWSYEDVFTYLKTGFAGITQEECDILENYVLMWNIRGTLWYRDEPWTFSQDGYKGEADTAVIEKLNIIKDKIVSPLKKLQVNMKTATANAERLYAVADFIDDISLLEQIEKRGERLISCGDRHMGECYLELGEVLVSALEQLYNVASYFTTTLDEFSYQLGLLLSQYELGVIPTGIDCVAVGDISRLRKRNIKHLFILGMTSENVPKISQVDGVFSDSERDELIELKLGLAQTSVQRLFGDISSLYDVITMAVETLTVMYPTVDAVGSVKEPSYIFENIMSCLNIKAKIPVYSDYKIFSKTVCREFAVTSHKTDSVAAAADEYFRNDKVYAEMLKISDEMSKIERRHISPEQAKKLYGDKVTMTASRVDKYNSCRYAYFLQYGLKAKPRMKAEFDAAVIGTFIHYLLENVTREVELRGGFAAVDDEACILLTKEVVTKYIDNELYGMKDKSKRFVYLFNTLTEDAISIVLNMASELRVSDFKPIDFELDFSYSGKLPPYEVYGQDTSLAVRGIVDRVDGWIHDDKLYIRVVDYKTGYKSFNLSDVWYGMGMQMLIYLFALQAMGKRRYNMEIVPAGILYAPAREVLLSESRHVTDADLEKNRLKSLKRSGMILNDGEVIEAMEHGSKKNYLPVKVGKDGSFSGDSLASAQQLGQLAKHIDKVLLDISREIFSGDVSADPYYRNQLDNSCTYCDYFHACHFSEERDGKYRELTKLKTPEVWENLQKEAENE